MAGPPLSVCFFYLLLLHAARRRIVLSRDRSLCYGVGRGVIARWLFSCSHLSRALAHMSRVQDETRRGPGSGAVALYTIFLFHDVSCHIFHAHIATCMSSWYLPSCLSRGTASLSDADKDKTCSSTDDALVVGTETMGLVSSLGQETLDGNVLSRRLSGSRSCIDSDVLKVKEDKLKHL
jgi:hypothetical protein